MRILNISCLNALKNALNDISNLDLKKNINSNVILWARKNKKKAQLVRAFVFFFCLALNRLLIVSSLAFRHFIDETILLFTGSEKANG